MDALLGYNFNVTYETRIELFERHLLCANEP